MIETGMGSVDLLYLSASAALGLRCNGDPEAGIAEGYKFLGRRPPRDKDDALAVRIARLICGAGERRADQLQFLWGRPKYQALLEQEESQEPEEELIEPDPEAERLYKVVCRRRVKKREMLADGFGGFHVSLRECAGGFGGRWVQRKSGWMRYKPDGLPERVRGLIDYPLEVPALFPIEVGKEPWSLWRICCAFADQYVRIYEHPDRYGVWGHDLADLCIESLDYYPNHQLIFPRMSS
jgi:hypothetical protein